MNTATETASLLTALTAAGRNGIGLAVPTNATTGREYTGGNVDRLNGVAPSNAYAGFGQWKKAGRVIPKGTKACAQIVFFKAGKDKETGEPKRIMRRKAVFAFEQTISKAEADFCAGLAALVAPREAAE